MAETGRRDAVLRALWHEDGPVPCQCLLDEPVRRALEARGVDVGAVLARNHVDWISLRDPSWRDISDTESVDQFGVSWRKATPGAPAHPTGPSATISPDYPRLPDPRDARRFEPVREAVAAGRDSFKVAMWRGPFEVSGFILTAEGLLADLAAEPARAARVLAAVTDFECALVDQVAGLGVDAIMIGDDYGHQHGPLVSPATWRRLIRPCLQALIERVKAHGLPFALHSDGAIGQLVGDLVDIGVDILNPVQPECCDPFALKREFGRRLTFHGATSSQGLFVRGRPEEVRRHLRETARVMSQRGGYIMAPSFVILAGTPVENALAFLDILDELRGA